MGERSKQDMAQAVKDFWSEHAALEETRERLCEEVVTTYAVYGVGDDLTVPQSDIETRRSGWYAYAHNGKQARVFDFFGAIREDCVEVNYRCVLLKKDGKPSTRTVIVTQSIDLGE